MARKHLKNLLSHTAGRSRHERIQQFSAAGVLSPGASGSSSSLIPGVTGVSGGPGSDVNDQVATLSKYLNDLRAAQQLSVDSTNENTRALVQNTLTKAAGSSTASTAGSLLSGILGSTFGLSPILKGLFSLFGGSGSNSQPAQPLVPFTLPPAIQYEGAYSSANRGQVSPIEYGQNGAPKVAAPPTTVQIQVNAMDSRSFLDHSADIAKAVREAMLHSSSLNDVISDL